jgi:integrase
LGHTRLAALTRPAVEAYVDDLQAGRLPDKRKRSPIMARAALQALKAVLADAMRRGQVAQNVARDVRVDRTRGEAKPKKEIGVNVPGKPEIRAMLEAVAPRWRPLLVTAIFTGCRASELRALRWRDVDLVARLIKVRQRADRWGGLGDPKSAAGSREIPMAPMLLNTLREWKLACPPSPGDLVFPGAGRAAGVLNHATLTRSVFGKTQIAAKIVEAAGKPKYSAHDFRHFFASWLIDQGFGPKRIMAILGHASIDVTFDVYGHLFELNESDHDRLAAGELALVTG